MAEMGEMEREVHQEPEERWGHQDPRSSRRERTGSCGTTGLQGPSGPKGATGPMGLPGLQGVPCNCAGMYVRWGRTTCPVNQSTELVYSGRAGGRLVILNTCILLLEYKRDCK